MASSRDAERLTAAWNAEWPETPPIGFLLRCLHADRWVRFHSLPGSKRYADTDEERKTVLDRHHAVLAALGATSELFVVWLPDAPTPDASLWQTIEAGEHFDVPVDLYARSVAYPSAEVDEILDAAADWQIAHVIIGPPDLRWLYHPYDGGADVIAPSPSHRDQLSAEFADWLSSHPAGL